MLKLGFGKVFQQLFAVGLQVRQQLEKLFDAVPQSVHGFFKAAKLGLLEHIEALREAAVGELFPQGVKLVPLGTQPAFELANHLLVGRVQRLDMSSRYIRKKGDAVALSSVAFADFQDAARPDLVADRLAENFLPRLAPNDRFQHHGCVANRHEARGLEHVHERQRALGGAGRHYGADLLAAIFRGCERHLVAHLEHLLDVQRPTRPETFRPTVVVAQAVAKVLQHRLDIRLVRVHERHHQRTNDVALGKDFVVDGHVGLSQR